ncbi:MAG: hypothetical protein V4529_17050 [Gemmatimonadota bacterium]
MQDKELIERFDDLKALTSMAISRAEIAATKAEATGVALLDMRRLTPDENGLPGFLPHIASQLVLLRREIHPVSVVRTYVLHAAISGAVALVVALLAGSCH